MRIGANILVGAVTLSSAAQAGSTRCWIDQGAVVVAAAFGPSAEDFIVDVGAATSSLHVTRANEDGITAAEVDGPLLIAGERLARVHMKVVDLDGIPQTDTSIAGVIGEDVLARYDVTITFAPCRLVLSSRRPRPAGALALLTDQGIPTVAVGVTDGVTFRRDRTIVSTARGESLIANATLSRALVQGSRAPIRLRALEVGGRLFEQAPAGLTTTGTGVVGTDVWRGWRTLRLSVGGGWMKLY